MIRSTRTKHNYALSNVNDGLVEINTRSIFYKYYYITYNTSSMSKNKIKKFKT